MFEDNLFTPMESDRTIDVTGSQFFISFLNQLEGWKTKCKNLHWASLKKNIHTYLDDFLIYFLTTKMVLQKDTWEYLVRCNLM